MVLSGENDYMATALARSRTLHNFAFASWGMQRHMKCIEVESNSDGSGPSGDSCDHQHQHHRGSPDFEFARSSVVIPLHLGETQLRKSPSKSAEKGSRKGIEEFREKIVRIKMAKSLFSKDAVEDDAKDQEERPEEVKRWNLRRRKPSSKVPIGLSNEDQSKELRTEERSATKKRERSVMAEAERKYPVNFSFQPSRNEIEEDFQRRKPSSKLPNELSYEDEGKELRTEERTVIKKRERCVMAEAERKYPVNLSFPLWKNEIEEDFQRRKPSSKVPIGLSNEDQSKELRTEERSATKKRERGVMAEAERKDPVNFSLQLSKKEIGENFQRRKLSSKVQIGLSNEDQGKELRREERTMTRKRGRGVNVMAETERKEPVKFSSQLSRKEIEEDFMQIMGRRPHCRPKKRPRNVQKLVDNVFPGLYFTQVTPDLYKVLEVAERRRR